MSKIDNSSEEGGNWADKSEKGPFGYSFNEEYEKHEPPGESKNQTEDETGFPPESDAISWREFTENTTFHGIKYVFQDSVHLRRIFWTLSILASVTFFVVQVGFRVRDYYEFHTVRSVSQVNDAEVDFPAVTFCNLNQYRISETAKAGLYWYLNEQLTKKEIVKLPDHLTESTSEIALMLGHNITELIDSCKWQGSPCNINTDFQTKLLDIGVCYTFNGNKTSVKSVRKEGVEGGLQLLLNVEVFEHMRGSHLDSGIKFLLHPPGHVPSLRNRGFVATPGYHTFVTIKTTETVRLPQPWGNCTEGGEAVANCKHRCISEDFIGHCDCIDIHMQDWPEYDMCDLGTKLTCGCNDLDKDVSTCGMNCTCQNPCSEITYTPTLSSAILSPINLNMFALSDEGEKKATNEKFQEATEIRLRLSTSHNKSFLTPAQSLSTAYYTISQQAQRFDVDRNMSLMSLIWPAADAYYHSVADVDPAELFERNKEKMRGKECGDDVQRVGRKLDTILEAGLYIYLQYKGFAAHPTFCGTDLDAMQFFTRGQCALGVAEGYVNQVCANCPLEAALSLLPSCNVTRMHCVCCHLGRVNSVVGDLVTFQQELENLPDYLVQSYKPYTGEVILARVVPPFLTPESAVTFYRCANLTKFLLVNNTIIPSVLTAVGVVGNGSITGTTYLGLISTLYSQLGETYSRELDGILEEKFVSACCWMKRYLLMEGERELIVGTTSPDPGVILERSSYLWAFQIFNEMSLAYFASEAQGVADAEVGNAVSSIEGHIRNLDRYINDDTYRTSELAQLFLDPVFRRQATNIITEGTFLYQSEIKIARFTERIDAYLKPYWDNFKERVIIAVTPDDLAKTVKTQLFSKPEIIRLVEWHMTPDCYRKHQPIYSPQSDVSLIELAALCATVEQVKLGIPILGQAIKNFEISMDSLIKALEEFQSKTIMDDKFYANNFMQVDLYYENIGYELVEEQEAFLLVSLFSEVGGFLGLLLGASILTVCELVDYLFTRIGASIQKKKIICPSKEGDKVTKRQTTLRQINVQSSP